MTKRMVAGGLLALLVGSGFPAAAQNQTPAAQIEQLLAKTDKMVGEKGFRPSGWTRRAMLPQERSELVPVTLEGGTTFVLFGVCDTGCSNLDLRVYDANGTLVTEDVKPDDAPIVIVESSGKYTLEIRMVACAPAACDYGVRLYRK